MNDAPSNITKDDAAFRLWVVQILTQLQCAMEESSKYRIDIEARIRKVESKVWWAAGAVAVLISIISRIRL